ncbi:MAG: DNA-directed RNA polymerase subunit omega [Clostridia bacterium]|nr:DNA-directed RNA polymerase subunit omega [Clostridia bacterium]
MIYPAVSNLIKEEKQCRYSLVIAVAKEARTIAERANNTNERLAEKPIKMAVNAFADGKAVYSETDGSEIEE